ncbi:MAG: hypothetical protein ACK4UW_20950 [Rhizobium rhizophilum]
MSKPYKTILADNLALVDAGVGCGSKMAAARLAVKAGSPFAFAAALEKKG